MFAAVKQYLRGNTFEDFLAVERIVTRWLKKKDTERYKKGEVKRKMKGKAVQLNMNCSY